MNLTMNISYLHHPPTTHPSCPKTMSHKGDLMTTIQIPNEKPWIIKDQRISFQGPGNLIRGAETCMYMSLSDSAMHLCTSMHELCTQTCITKKVMVQIFSKNIDVCKISMLLCTFRKVQVHLTGTITKPSCTIMKNVHRPLLSYVILAILEFIEIIKVFCYAHQRA